MIYAVRIVGIAVVAGLVMTLATGRASALEVVDEGSNDHCPAVLPADHGVGSFGCVVHFSSEGGMEFRSPLGVTTCTLRFEWRLDEAGNGYIENQVFGTQGCGLVPCAEVSRDVWPTRMTSETTAEADICATAFGFLTVSCHLPNIRVQESFVHGALELSTANASDCENPSYGFEGHWSGLGTEVEIVD
jgi:hypothetical protein